MKKTHKVMFTRIAEFKFNNQVYQMFKARKNKIAFLKINEKGHYEFPTYKEFTLLVRFFSMDRFDTLAHFRSERHNKVAFTPYIKEVVNGKVKKVMITSLLALSCLNGCQNVQGTENVYSYDAIYEDKLSDSFSTTTEEETETVDYIDEYDDNSGFYETEDFDLIEGSNFITLYNNKYFDELFGEDYGSLETIQKNLDKNQNIDDEYKIFIMNFVERMNEYYPDLENRVFAYNIRDLKITFKARDMIDIDTDAEAYYDAKNNELVVDETLDFQNNLRDRLVLRHELGHLFNNVKLEKDGYTIRYYFNDVGHGKYLKEALDVIFTTEPFMDEYEGQLLQNGEYITENMGYPLTTNLVRVLLDAMDYNIQDSVSHNVYYFDKKMNEVSPEGVDFDIIEELIELQCLEYLDDSITVNQEEYIDLYEYITDVYINTNLNETMSYNEVYDHCMQLQEALKRGVSNSDYVYMDVIEENFKNYIDEHNIEKSYVK